MPDAAARAAMVRLSSSARQPSAAWRIAARSAASSRAIVALQVGVTLGLHGLDLAAQDLPLGRGEPLHAEMTAGLTDGMVNGGEVLGEVLGAAAFPPSAVGHDRV